MVQMAYRGGRIKPLRLVETDAEMPRHWRSGSLKYAEFAPLAEGGVASVERCVDQNLGRRVAFKRLHPHLSEDDVETRRFLREARVTAMIPHPGTVPIYELGRDRDGALFFSMKLLEGKDLRSILEDLANGDAQASRDYPTSRLVDILIHCCHTIDFAHQQGVIHRDIKPANIQVGGFGEVTVLDWGLAKVRDETDLPDCVIPSVRETIDQTLTQPGRRCGTPLYMSPEQAQGSTDLDERTDIYNLGAVLYEMLTFRGLVYGESIDEVIKHIVETPAPAPSKTTLRRRVPVELEAICLKALAKDSADRYASVGEMTQDLIAYRQGRRVSACRYSAWLRFRRWRKRHMVLTSSAVALAVGALTGAAVAWCCV